MLDVPLRAFRGRHEEGDEGGNKSQQEITKRSGGLTSGMIAKKHMTKINVSCPFPSSAK